MAEKNQRSGLRPFINPANAWAFALGTSVGWGSMVVTSNTCLAQAGPLGSALGFLTGAAVMLIIARNYHYMMVCCQEAGGAYAYVRDAFGPDRSFLVAWFLTLTYLAMLWANATSLPLFARYFAGGFFRFGYLYSIFGYEVYTGEALLTVAAVSLTAWISIRAQRIVPWIMTAMAGIFTLGILLVFCVSIFRCDRSLAPAFVPDGRALSQTVRIAVLSPWAFIGFENISHLTEEFSFRRSRSFRILTAAVAAATLLYVCVTLLSVTAYPEQYGSWLEYIRGRGSLEGISALPAFYAANHYMGSFGVGVMMISLLCLIFTSLFGNTFALSRLFWALARDGVLPKRLSGLTEDGAPERAILLLALLSSPIPFVGRTAIGWIVDVTTLGATLTYGFVSAAAWKTAAFRHDRLERGTGAAGTFIMSAFGLYLIVPSFFGSGSIETETFFLFMVWSVLGLLYFHRLVKSDPNRSFGAALTVWIAFLSVLLFISLIWMQQYDNRATAEGLRRVQEYYQGHVSAPDGGGFIGEQLVSIQKADERSALVVAVVFAVSLGVLSSNYNIMSRRAKSSEAELSAVRTLANTDPMTGVKSKHAYAEAEAIMEERIRTEQVGEFAVAVCDVNGLKHINDTCGHKAGDRYICDACRLICTFFKHSPVFRVGGDEFVVILEGPDFENRAEILETLDRKVESHIGTDDAVVSVGLAVFGRGKDDCYRAVFERADGLMYARKQELKAMGSRTRD